MEVHEYLKWMDGLDSTYFLAFDLSLSLSNLIPHNSILTLSIFHSNFNQPINQRITGGHVSCISKKKSQHTKKHKPQSMHSSKPTTVTTTTAMATPMPLAILPTIQTPNPSSLAYSAGSNDPHPKSGHRPKHSTATTEVHSYSSTLLPDPFKMSMRSNV